ncbi:hypothetical protein DH2020_046231 [Rehmannia glutinosa]|uniref:NAC domain-containing protein n=1 Tax=Rehmannia glutinosa TaxID=99300 RepID=A0ABR0UCV2_REHGL
MGLRDIGDTLPPGFRFYPSDEELVCHYLYKKITNEQVITDNLVEIDLHTCEPWQLPDVAKLNSSEWYFFSFRDRKYATGFRTNRATISGYWKATGKDRAILSPKTWAVVGMRKTLVFYKNRAPNGIKTGWIMHEFRLENPHVPPKEDWVLCRVFHKSSGENSNKLINPQNLYHDSTIGATSNLVAPHTEHALPSSYQNINNTPGVSPIDPGYLHLSQDHMNGSHPSTSTHNQTKFGDTKCEDDYGFLFDMSFDSCSNGVISSNVDGMRFGNDNSSVFI